MWAVHKEAKKTEGKTVVYGVQDGLAGRAALAARYLEWYTGKGGGRGGGCRSRLVKGR